MVTFKSIMYPSCPNFIKCVIMVSTGVHPLLCLHNLIYFFGLSTVGTNGHFQCKRIRLFAAFNECGIAHLLNPLRERGRECSKQKAGSSCIKIVVMSGINFLISFHNDIRMGHSHQIWSCETCDPQPLQQQSMVKSLGPFTRVNSL